MYDPTTIVLADATDLLLIGAWAVLMRNPEFSVEAAVTQLDTLLTVTRHFKPQVIIFGERLSPEQDVYQIIGQLHEITPSAHLIVLGEPVQ